MSITDILTSVYLVSQGVLTILVAIVLIVTNVGTIFCLVRARNILRTHGIRKVFGRELTKEPDISFNLAYTYFGKVYFSIALLIMHLTISMLVIYLVWDILSEYRLHECLPRYGIYCGPITSLLAMALISLIYFVLSKAIGGIIQGNIKQLKPYMEKDYS